MQTVAIIRNRCLQALAATALVAGLGVSYAQAQTAAGNGDMNSAAQGQTGKPSKATCEKEAKGQGLSGSQAEAFVKQCMHGA